MTGTYRLGIDIGGTFTDGVLIDERTGTISIGKVSSTPADPSEGFLTAALRLLNEAGCSPEGLQSIIHATTVATNALLERRGSEAALLVTEGFSDILEIARQVRYELYNLQTEKPVPLVPRQRSLPIPERLDFRGEVLAPLNEAAVAAAATSLRDAGIESIAICFLHSYINPTHERRAAEIVRQVHPGAVLSLSCGIAPEIREYWRASTTVTNAYIKPLVQRYLGTVDRRLRGAGLGAEVHIVQSNGGIMSAAAAKERPIAMLESGPAAGVAAAAYFAAMVGRPDAISFDMGGTTAKAGLIREGRPAILTEFEAGAVAGTGAGLAKGSGYPILGPVMDLVEVGAGGGSIAWIDAGGLLRVGPRSAGAVPGPVCYGQGGEEPTVSDANLLLGRLDPNYFLGGEIVLDREASLRAIEQRCAGPLGLEPVEAAMGIVEIANAAMVGAMRLISVQRGYDPADFALVAFGGAGPLHANQLMRELHIPLCVVPPSPGVASATGMLVTDLRHDYRQTALQPLDGVRIEDLETIYASFEERARSDLAAEGVGPESITLERSLDLRYVGQSWKLPVSVPEADLSPQGLSRVRERFDTQHEQRYGYAVAGEPVEVVNVALSALGHIPKPNLPEMDVGNGSPAAARKSTRQVYFSEAGGFVETEIYDRYRLRMGDVIPGPAVVEEMDATTVIHPGYQAEVGRFGLLLIREVA